MSDLVTAVTGTAYIAKRMIPMKHAAQDTNPWRRPRQIEEAEEMDAAGVDRGRLVAALRFIRKVNALLGYTRATLRHLERLTHELGTDRPITILDVATGSADVPQAIHRWARRRGVRVSIVGLDLHAVTLQFAREEAGDDVRLVRGDALRLPFQDGQFDVVMTSMFLHHLPTALAVDVLREMDRVAGGAVIVADLVRSRMAYRGISLLTLFSDPMVRHDATVSVRQAFTLEEAADLTRDAGLDYLRLHPHAAWRFVLAGRKAAAIG